MKIAISSTGKDLKSQADARFGRCHYFIEGKLTEMSEATGPQYMGFK